MNELRRLAYLQAMGVDSYVSRVDLPGAAASRRLRLVSVQVQASDPGASDLAGGQTVAPAASAGAQQQRVQQVADSLASDLRAASQPAAVESTAAPSPELAPAVGTGARNTQVPVFSIVAVFCGGYCWLEEFPRGQAPGTDYLQLLQSICVALQRSADAPVLEQFSWPMSRSTQLEHHEESAREGVAGFLGARFEHYQPARLVLLGEAVLRWFDPAQAASLPVVQTVSARDMLRQGSLKARAWKDLVGSAAGG